MLFYAIRGAITIEGNTPQEIREKTKTLLKTIIKKNSIDHKDIVSIIFTGTKDLDAEYPAVAAREMEMVNVPLFCCQEMYVEGSLTKCIRVLMHVQLPESRDIEHIYLGRARSLRPDLAHGSATEKGEQEILNIAIDGPAGAGKSTIAKIIAQELDIVYLDTGAMYRAVAYKAIRSNIDLEDKESIVAMLSSTNVEIKYHRGNQKMILDGEDVTPQIRSSDVSQAASKIAVIPEVRIKLVDLQREIARTRSWLDGRDIGTYVLPKASLKFYLTASLEERAKRRWKEMMEKGIEESIESIRQGIKERDTNDQNRSFAPLKQSEDAVLVDTPGKSIEEVSTEILEHVYSYLEKR